MIGGRKIKNFLVENFHVMIFKAVEFFYWNTTKNRKKRLEDVRK